jgi:phosphoglycolate phosphatase-like HAD superfamily hydrolase
MNFDCYLFDLDNSLLYIPNPPEYFDNILKETIEFFSKNGLPPREQRNKFWLSGDQYKILLKEWGVILEDFNEFWEKFDALDFEFRKQFVPKGKIRLFSDVLYVLNELMKVGKKLAIVSNTARYIVDYIIREFGLEDYFDEIFGLGYGNEQNLAKPSPEGIKMILHKLDFDLEHSNALMIGDSIVDIFAAKRANIHACLLKRNFEKYPDGYSDWEHQPDFVIEDLEEILKLKPNYYC